MKAEIFSIGTELLMGELTDTNAAWIAAVQGFECDREVHGPRQTPGMGCENTFGTALHRKVSLSYGVFPLWSCSPPNLLRHVNNQLQLGTLRLGRQHIAFFSRWLPKSIGHSTPHLLADTLWRPALNGFTMRATMV